MSWTREYLPLQSTASLSAIAEDYVVISAKPKDFSSLPSTESLPYINPTFSASTMQDGGDTSNAQPNKEKKSVTRSRPSRTRRLRAPNSPDGLKKKIYQPPVPMVQGGEINFLVVYCCSYRKF